MAHLASGAELLNVEPLTDNQQVTTQLLSSKSTQE